MKIVRWGEKPGSAVPGTISGQYILIFSLLGTALAVGTVYLGHYVFVQELAPTSLAAVLAGLGLLTAFCVLTAVMIGGIRLLIIDPLGRTRPVIALVIALISLAVLAGLIVFGLEP